MYITCSLNFWECGDVVNSGKVSTPNELINLVHSSHPGCFQINISNTNTKQVSKPPTLSKAGRLANERALYCPTAETREVHLSWPQLAIGHFLPTQPHQKCICTSLPLPAGVSVVLAGEQTKNMALSTFCTGLYHHTVQLFCPPRVRSCRLWDWLHKDRL